MARLSIGESLLLSLLGLSPFFLQNIDLRFKALNQFLFIPCRTILYGSRIGSPEETGDITSYFWVERPDAT